MSRTSVFGFLIGLVLVIGGTAALTAPDATARPSPPPAALWQSVIAPPAPLSLTVPCGTASASLARVDFWRHDAAGGYVAEFYAQGVGTVYLSATTPAYTLASLAISDIVTSRAYTLPLIFTQPAAVNADLIAVDVQTPACPGPGLTVWRANVQYMTPAILTH